MPPATPQFRRGPISAVSDKATAERIINTRSWTERLFSFRLARPAAFRFEPGQFARLGIASASGGIIWRAYSMVSASHDEPEVINRLDGPLDALPYLCVLVKDRDDLGQLR